jgi:hypothetical protein
MRQQFRSASIARLPCVKIAQKLEMGRQLAMIASKPGIASSTLAATVSAFVSLLTSSSNRFKILKMGSYPAGFLE